MALGMRSELHYPPRCPLLLLIVVYGLILPTIANPSRTPSWCSFTEVVNERVVLVGGGPAGASLARSIADRGIDVLVVEQGEADQGSHSTSEKIGDWTKAACWGGAGLWYETESQKRLWGRRIMAFRGQGGGGSSNVNAGIWMRGRESDYQGWADWTISDITAAFDEVEGKLSLNPVFPTRPGLSLIQIMTEGQVPHPHPQASSSGWLREGIESPFTVTHEGLRRKTPWHSLIEARGGVKEGVIRVLDATRVNKVLLEGSRAVGLHVTTRLRGQGRIMLGGDGGEIVLCAGAFESPKLLMLSGIGPREDLETHGIPVSVDSDAVGKHLQDHVVFPVITASRRRLGRKDTNGHGVHGLVNLRSPAGDYQFMLADSTWIPNIAPHLAASIAVPGTGAVAGLLRRVVRRAVALLLALPPLNWLLSEGYVKLGSSDPASPPLVDPMFLTSDEDLDCLKHAVAELRRCQESSSAARELLGWEVLPGVMCGYAKSQEGLKWWSRHFGFSYFHPVGTCRMGPDPSTCVVDHQLRVYGVSNLRIADASVAPRIPSAPTMAMCCMIGTRAASLIAQSL